MHRFDPAKADRLLSPERDQWLRPDHILEAMALKPGLCVLDLGAGPGYFSLPMASRVAPLGRIIAVDIEPRMLYYLRRRMATTHISGILPVIADRVLPFVAASFDRALLSLILHEANDRDLLLTETHRILRPGGSAFIVEWHPWPTAHGPEPTHRLNPEDVIRAARLAGFEPQEPQILSEDVYLLQALKV